MQPMLLREQIICRMPGVQVEVSWSHHVRAAVQGEREAGEHPRFEAQQYHSACTGSEPLLKGSAWPAYDNIMCFSLTLMLLHSSSRHLQAAAQRLLLLQRHNVRILLAESTDCGSACLSQMLLPPGVCQLPAEV